MELSAGTIWIQSYFIKILQTVDKMSDIKQKSSGFLTWLLQN